MPPALLPVPASIASLSTENGTEFRTLPATGSGTTYHWTKRRTHFVPRAQVEACRCRAVGPSHLQPLYPKTRLECLRSSGTAINCIVSRVLCSVDTAFSCWLSGSGPPTAPRSLDQTGQASYSRMARPIRNWRWSIPICFLRSVVNSKAGTVQLLSSSGSGIPDVPEYLRSA